MKVVEQINISVDISNSYPHLSFWR